MSLTCCIIPKGLIDSFSLLMDTMKGLPIAYNREIDKNSEHVLVTSQVNNS